jgi:lipopolysaccharide/colanic/teichoic acid biosynthesis glycosyltransferase
VTGPYRGKRAVDLTLATVALLPALVMCLIAATVIRVTSRGPVTFSQRRAGLDGAPFTMWKLRTMRVDPSRRSILPQPSDVTAVGRLLRRLSIDELPQLVNVLRGEMSIVGPRPALEAQAARLDERQRQRMTVRPGMTGLAAVSGRNELTWAERIDLDLIYLERQSVWHDLGIVARTFGVVLAGRGVGGHSSDDAIAAVDPQR